MNLTPFIKISAQKLAVIFLFVAIAGASFFVGKRFGEEREQVRQVIAFSVLISNYEDTGICMPTESEFIFLKEIDFLWQGLLPSASKWMAEEEVSRLNWKIAVRLTHLAQITQNPQIRAFEYRAAKLSSADSVRNLEKAISLEKERELKRNGSRCRARMTN